jgi:hypothetical protein
MLERFRRGVVDAGLPALPTICRQCRFPSTASCAACGRAICHFCVGKRHRGFCDYIWWQRRNQEIEGFYCSPEDVTQWKIYLRKADTPMTLVEYLHHLDRLYTSQILWERPPFISEMLRRLEGG